MSRATQPTETISEHAGDRETKISHPSFGMLHLSRASCSPPGAQLFGSELRHQHVMMVELKTASGYRSLHHERIHEDQLLARFSLSLAQWAEFISSAGMGAGVPVTLEHARTGPLERMPEIEPPYEQHTDKFKREMQEGIDKHTAGLRAALDDLEATGKCTGAAREALKEARRHAEQLPGNLGFVNDSFARATEHVVASAKTELEGFVVGMALRTGIKALAAAAPSLDVLESKR